MRIWDLLTWGTVVILGPVVLLVCALAARDLRRLLGAPAGPEARRRSEDGHD